MNKPQAALFQGTVKEIFTDHIVVSHIANGKEQSVRIGGPTIRQYARRAVVGEMIGFDDFLAPMTVRRVSQPQA